MVDVLDVQQSLQAAPELASERDGFKLVAARSDDRIVGSAHYGLSIR